MKLLFTALMFYTRLPVPRSTGFSPDNLNRATRFFPFIGYIVGGTGALAFWGASQVLPVDVAVVLSMVSQALVTGAFHEDAFADFCDGFGGGYTQKRILEIMKDSRIGTYGAVGLIMMLLAKFVLLSDLGLSFIHIALFVAHPVSRLSAVFFIYTSKYVSASDKSKSKPIGHRGSAGTFVIALFFGLAPLVLLSPFKVLLIMAALVSLFLYFRYYVTKHIGGYTGDVLGALQQLSEIVVYMVLLLAV